MELPKLPQPTCTWGGPTKALAQDTGSPWCPDLHVTLGTALPLWAWSPHLSVGWVVWGEGCWLTRRALPIPPTGPWGLGPTCSGLRVCQDLPPGPTRSVLTASCPGTGGHTSLGPLCVPLQSHHSSKDRVLPPIIRVIKNAIPSFSPHPNK